MSDQFSRYELDLLDFIKFNKVKLADKIPIAGKDERKPLLRQVNKDVDNMNSIVNKIVQNYFLELVVRFIILFFKQRLMTWNSS